ncbi:MAG: hypothetical protein U0166_24185 [Acidobacteriota bacterium]
MEAIGAASSVVAEAVRDHRSILDRIRDGQDLGAFLKTSLLGSAVGAAMFGMALGSFAHSLPQLVISTVKMPILLLGSAGLCFPAFFVLQTLVAPNPLDLARALSLQASALLGAGIVWGSMAPPAMFLIATSSDYPFSQLLALGIGGLGGLVAVVRLLQGYLRLCGTGWHPKSLVLLLGYGIVFGMVGAQLSWVMRPFVGSPTMPPTLFRNLQGNIFTAILHLLGMV